MESNLKIFYIGSLDENSNSFRRFEALANLCKSIKGLNSDPFIMAPYISGIQHYYNIGLGIYLFNRKIRKQVKKKNFDIIWVDNKNYLSVETLLYIKQVSPKTKIINLLTDDPFGEFKSSWRLLYKTASLYNMFFVQREQNIAELQQIGAKRVALCYRSFAPDYNRPLTLSEADKEKYATLVGFVGSYEKEREETIAWLIEQGVTVTVTGNGWPDKPYWETIKPYYKGPSVYGEGYIKTINGMAIALHFLRKANRDDQDSRTFEIPACKVFMLAEYSAVHADLFRENEEAVYFRNKEELLEKIIFYKTAEEERKRIAGNGYARCFASGYDHAHTLERVLKQTLTENFKEAAVNA